jgi:quinol monooxygenase YgiN
MSVGLLFAMLAPTKALMPAMRASSLRMAPSRIHATSLARRATSSARMAVAEGNEVAILVDVEIEPARVEEFLKVIETDAVGSRAENGCRRFDVLRASDTRFMFYEVYVDQAAVDFHKAAAHFKVWSDFKASGGVVSQTSTKAGFPGPWGFA